MTRLFIVLALLFGSCMAACNNDETTPANAGTADSSGIGHAKGKGTPYRGDSAVKGIQSDTITH